MAENHKLGYIARSGTFGDIEDFLTDSFSLQFSVCYFIFRLKLIENKIYSQVSRLLPQ